MKTLTIEQVKQLEAKGVTFDDTLLVHFTAQGEENAQLIAMDSVCYMTYPNEDGQDYTPAPTLQEVLDKLPRTITHKEENYSLTFMPSMIEGRFGLGYYRVPHAFAIQITESTMYSAYEMLNWVLDNGHLISKK